MKLMQSVLIPYLRPVTESNFYMMYHVPVSSVSLSLSEGDEALPPTFISIRR